jgi:hypothetical protein
MIVEEKPNKKNARCDVCETGRDIEDLVYVCSCSPFILISNPMILRVCWKF